MPITATIPIANVRAANAALEAQGFGPENFTVPLRTGTGGATHVGLHCWDDPAFIAALKALPFPIEFTETANKTEVTFTAHIRARAFDERDITEWFVNPVMKGDRRTFDGKEWESLLDFNVWPPGVTGWREIVASGPAPWRQPLGAQDAYPLNAVVTHQGREWRSTVANNVWVPGAFGWV